MSNEFYYKNLSLAYAEKENERVLNVEIPEPTLKNVSLRTEMINLAAQISKSSGNERPGLVFDGSYESALMALAFFHAGVDFNIYQIVFSKEPVPYLKTLAEFIKKHTSQDIHEIWFDFANEEHMAGLEKLGNTFNPQKPEELFSLWLACQMEETTVFPGRFVVPLHGSGGYFSTWDLPNNNDFALYTFLKEFGGIPSFFSGSPEVVHGQIKMKNNSYLRDIFKNQRRSLNPTSSVFRKQLAEEFGFVEIKNYSEPVYNEPAFKTALKKFPRKTKEDLACIFHRTRRRQRLSKINCALNSAADEPIEVNRDDVDYKSLLSCSETLKFLGGFIEVEKTDDSVQSLALFPTLMTIHQYKGDMKVVDSVVRSLEFFYNLDNYYTRTDIHHVPELSELIEFFKKATVNYFEKMAYVYDDFEIVQCWANKAEHRQIHHLHRHPNSLLSGVFYITEGWGGGTVYVSKSQNEIVPAVHKFTPWNTRTLQVQPARGQLVLFPSSLEHHVLEHLNDKTERYTIAFNVMLRGEIGDLINGSWLNL